MSPRINSSRCQSLSTKLDEGPEAKAFGPSIADVLEYKTRRSGILYYSSFTCAGWAVTAGSGAPNLVRMARSTLKSSTRNSSSDVVRRRPSTEPGIKFAVARAREAYERRALSASRCTNRLLEDRPPYRKLTGLAQTDQTIRFRRGTFLPGLTLMFLPGEWQ